MSTKDIFLTKYIKRALICKAKGFFDTSRVKNKRVVSRVLRYIYESRMALLVKLF